MEDQQLTADVKALLHDNGAALVAFGDLTALPTDSRKGMPVGIIFAMPLDPMITASLVDGPSPAYAAEYERLNEQLQVAGDCCATWLAARGHQAISQGVTVGALDRKTLSVVLPHKTIATRAGLGWIGKCALLVTEAYGSAIRLNTVLTDAPLVTGTSIDHSRCGDCIACREACPGAAPTGENWNAGMPRKVLFDAFACFYAAKAQAEPQGIRHTICGRCIAACPWTRKYLDRAKMPSRR